MDYGNFDLEGAAFGLPSVGSFNPPSPLTLPEPLVQPVTIDPFAVLERAASTAVSVARTWNQFESARNSVAIAREDRDFSRFMAQLGADTSRSVAVSKADVEKLRAQAEVERARAALNPSAGLAYLQSAFAGAGGGGVLSQLLPWLVLAGGAWLAWRLWKGAR